MMHGKAKPVHLIAGGRGARRKGPDPLLAAALRLAGKDRPSVAYVGTASGDALAFRTLIGGFMKTAGAGPVRLAPLAGRRADPDAARRVLEAADIVFVSGGDVEAGMEGLAKAGMADFLRNLYADGIPFFGISAGSLMLAKAWVRWKDPEDDATAEAFPCLGMAPVLCDAHGEEDGWAELRALLSLSPEGTLGYGIRSGSALVWKPDGPGSGAASGGCLKASGGAVDVFERKDGAVTAREALEPD